MSQRHFLRRQMIEYKELNGLRRGCRVSAIVDNQLEHGTVKWIGTIKGTLYIGIEFERPVGNQFPETHGAAPFSCSLSHSRLVFPEDVKTGRRSNIIMEYQQHGHHNPKQLQDDDNYLLEGVSSSISYLHLSGGSSSDIGTDTDTENSLVNRNNYLKHKNMDLRDDEDDDSEFVSTHSISSLSSSSNNTNTFCDAIYANISELSVQQMREFDEKISMFYKLCSQTKRLIKEYQMKYEELPLHCRFEDSTSAASINLDRLESFRGEVRKNITDRMEQCKSKLELVSRYSEFLVPSEEKKMNREIEEAEESFSSLDQEICSDIARLVNFNIAYQTLQDLLQERLSRFTVIKTRLVQVERNLVRDEGALCLRIKGIQSILSVLERDHDTSENSEIRRLLDVVRFCDYMDISRVLRKTEDLIVAEKHLLEDVRAKRALLVQAKESYNKFLTRLNTFQKWYTDYMNRLSETKVTGPDFDVQHPALVKEREERRKEFIEILASAKNLRASIFDPSAVDKKIETLQEQWKALVEKLYRARSRKTV